MSVQFGRWNFEGQQISERCLDKIGSILAPYGPDSGETYSGVGTNVLYRPFHTTKESNREKQPHISASGAVITWDGRLDNRGELIGELGGAVTISSTDVEIVAAAYDKWGISGFPRLMGDWALSVFNPRDHVLVLAKDPIGTRHLYYSFDNHQVSWCTILDPLVLCADKCFALCEEYVAGWLAYFPSANLTPYVGIDAVPPSSFVLFRPGKRIICKFWDFDPSKTIRYHSDAEYEEHFRAVFAAAVRRRLRSDCPVLAELSGGRDSSAIVCMADAIIAQGDAETPRLDTISYYDDSEPTWNERPYFIKVEEKRGRTGWHINLGPQDTEKAESDLPIETFKERLAATPAYDGGTLPQFRKCLTSQGNRVVLSGTGGDEVMGGVPTASPELQNLISRAHFKVLAHQLKVWALEKRRPWFHLLFEAVRGFFPPALVGVPKPLRPVPWLQSRFVEQNWRALTGYPSRTTLSGPLPSFQDNVHAIDGLRRQLGCNALPIEPLYEKRYPYLDRTLLEFMFAIPREQLVRPTQRRVLMRRALVGIVPYEILNKKHKAFVTRSPLVTISKDWAHLAELTQHMVSHALGIVDSRNISNTLQKARRGEEVPIVPLMRAILLEGWLRNLRRSGIANLESQLKPNLGEHPYKTAEDRCGQPVKI
jgi:asparagine synthase (glutamine-hydrolysing)